MTLLRARFNSNSKSQSDFKCLSYIKKQREFLLSKAQEIEASNRKKWNFMVELWFPRKKYNRKSPMKDFRSMKLEVFSDWGKHPITTPFHTCENKRLEIKWEDGPFQNVGISSGPWTMRKHYNPPPCHPQLHFQSRMLLPQSLRAFLGSLLLHNTAAACARTRDYQVGAQDGKGDVRRSCLLRQSWATNQRQKTRSCWRWL